MLIFILGVISCFLLTNLSAQNYQKQSANLNDPPCFFNPLCFCSKTYPDLGRVTCKNVPLLRMPQQINSSKLFTLHLENNHLRYVEPYFLKFTGLFRIEIVHNLLTEIDKETFAGLEKSLWEINLHHNRFKRVPSQSFRNLQKLKFLDLSDNEITNIGSEDWLGLEHSLKILLLSGNKLSTLNPRMFSMLQQLETLDLSRNILYELDTFAFKDGLSSLNELYLADNLLSNFPLYELSDLRNLRYLDLSFNLITEIRNSNLEPNKKKAKILNLDTLRLDYNKIQLLPEDSFKDFPSLTRVHLNGNQISYIEKGAFGRSKIREIYLRDCDIFELTTDVFFGMENFLEVLDLEGNNLTTLPLFFFKRFNSLRSLSLKENFLKEIDFDKMFEPSLRQLDLSGRENTIVSFEKPEVLQNLRSLSLSRLPQSTLSSDNIPENLINLEELKISRSNILNVQNHAFKNVRGLKRLDFSENFIATIQHEAFSEVGHSLIHLSLANGLSSSLTQIPSKIFKDLTFIESLDLSNNRLKVLPKELFYSMKRLKTLQIQDNFIEFIPKETFQDDIHSELNTIHFSFNQLSFIESETFKDLTNLQYLWLNDNKIIKIEKSAFVNLKRLNFLFLRGNKINILDEESFQELPELEKLDLAYNKLKNFNFNCFEQVGTLSSFTLNVSHNAIEKLTRNVSAVGNSSVAVAAAAPAVHVNIKALDFSHNNISFIEPRYFKPVESSITHLYLSHNKLQNVTENVFGNLIFLQWLDLSYNNLSYLEDNSLRNSKNIQKTFQLLYISDNHLREIPKKLFKGFYRLRVLDLANNDLRTLPDNLFTDVILQRLNLSNNRLTRIPVNCFDSDSAAVLSELDLTENLIMTLPSADAFAAFKNLFELKLSNNRIIRIEDGIFSQLDHLHVLDLSHNAELTLDSKGQTFHGLYDTLDDLILKNLSLSEIPLLHFRFLRSLDLSDNNIFNIPFEVSQNLSHLHRIELAGNKLAVIPPAVNAMTKLQYLGISRNPLKSVNIQQNFNLRKVDIRNVSLNALEKGALSKIFLLQSLKLSINRNAEGVNLPHLLKDNIALKTLYIEVTEEFSFDDEINGPFPSKLQNMVLSGGGLKTIPETLLQGVKNPRFNLEMFNTSVQDISEDVFENAKEIRNLTLNVKSNKLKTMGNPNTGDSPNISKKIFLSDLQISDNYWNCDCSIGWIEEWERKKRQYLCRDNSEDCFTTSDNLRNSFCSNREKKTVLDVFKQELECEWNSSTNLKSSILWKFLIISVLFRFLIL